MDGVLQSRQHVLNGIANGIDTDEWDPAADKHIPKTFTPSDLKGNISILPVFAGLCAEQAVILRT